MFKGQKGEEEANFEGMQAKLNDLESGMNEMGKDMVKNFSYIKRMMKEMYGSMRSSGKDLRRLSKLSNLLTSNFFKNRFRTRNE